MKIINDLENEHGKMNVNTEKIHTYCGMTLIYDNDGSVSIDIRDYLEETIDKFGEDCSRSVNSPAAKHLFETNNEQVKLNEEKKLLFH